MAPSTPHRSNVPGDFYVEDGCCLSCSVPQNVAPSLFAYETDGHCYVRKQPVSADEMDQMLNAFEVQEASCIRYKGANRIVQMRLVNLGEGEQCDLPDLDLVAKIQAIKLEQTAERAKSNRRPIVERLFRWFRGS